jgi:DNA invertase Pin-like site-specific DNA recombinase
MPLVFGYARVSTDGQTLEAQLAQLEAAGAGVGGGRLIQEKVSGAKRDRPQLARLLASLSPGEVVLVTRLDRLARSTRDLLNVLDAVADKDAAFRS